MMARLVGSRKRSSVGIQPAAGWSAWAWPRRTRRGAERPGVVPGDPAGVAGPGAAGPEPRGGAGQVRDRGRGLVQVPGAEHDADPAVQVLMAEQSHGVMLAQQREQALAV